MADDTQKSLEEQADEAARLLPDDVTHKVEFGDEDVPDVLFSGMRGYRPSACMGGVVKRRRPN